MGSPIMVGGTPRLVAVQGYSSEEPGTRDWGTPGRDKGPEAGGTPPPCEQSDSFGMWAVKTQLSEIFNN